MLHLKCFVTEKNSFFFPLSAHLPYSRNVQRLFGIQPKEFRSDDNSSSLYGGCIVEMGQPLSAHKNETNEMMECGWRHSDKPIFYDSSFVWHSGWVFICFFFQFCGPKEQYAIIFKCSLCNFTMAFDTRLDIIRPRIREFEWRDCGLSAVVGLKNRVCANFHELHSLFLRWPAYLLKMTTSISRFGQNVCSLATVKFQLEYEFMFDSFATIGSVKCIPKVAPLT